VKVTLAANALTVGETEGTSTGAGYLSAADWIAFNGKQPAGSYLTTVTVSSPLSGTGVVGSPLAIPAATSGTNGYLTAADWITFNSKGAGAINTLTLSSPLTGGTLTTSGTIGIQTATSTQSGAISSTDWGTFNGRSQINTLTLTSPLTGGTLTSSGTIGLGLATSTTSGYLSSTDWGTFNGKLSGNQTITLSSDVTGTGTTTIATTITSGSVTLAKMANLAANSLIGNNTITASTPVALSAAQTKTLLGIAQADVSGLTTTSSPTFAGLTVDTSTIHVDSTNHRVGVGTTTPPNQLSVVTALAKTTTSTIYPLVFYTSDASNPLELVFSIGGNATAGSRFCAIESVESGVLGRALLLNPSNMANVGIGTFTPTCALDVNGQIRTAAPTGVTAKPWTLGDYSGGYVNVGVNGTTYALATSAAGGGSVTNFSAGNLSPLFTTTVSNATTTPALSFTFSAVGANSMRPNFFNVVSGYGAVPNVGGDAAANVTAINNAIADLNAAGGGTLYFPAGTYYINSALRAITVNCTVLGDGWGCTQIQQSANAVVLTFSTQGNYVEVRGLCVNGPGAAAILLGATGAPMHGLIEDCLIIGATKGIDIWGQNQTNVRDCTIGCTYSVYYENPGTGDYGGGLVEGCTLTGTTASVYTKGDGVQVLGDYIFGGQYGIVQYVGSGVNMVDLWATGNHIEGQSVAAISVQGSGSFSNIQITGNEADYESTSPSGEVGVDFSAFTGSAAQVTITGNTFGSGADNCINLAHASNVVLTGNTLACSATGISVASSCSNGWIGTNAYACTTNVSDNASFSGYYTTAVASGSALSLSTNTPVSVCYLTVPQGTYNVWGVVDYAFSTASADILQAGVSITSGTFGAQDSYQTLLGSVATNSHTATVATPVCRITATGSTNIYLIADAEITLGTVGAYGSIFAQRVQ
jgi:hypothetical protein